MQLLKSLFLFMSLAWWGVSIVYADEGVVPQRIKRGDAISADFLNDMLDRIDNVAGGFSSRVDLVGSWDCTTFALLYGGVNCLAGFEPADGGIFLKRNQEVTFSCSTSNCTWNSQYFYPFSCESVPASWNSGQYDLRGSLFAITLNNNGRMESLMTQISKHSPTRITLGNGGRSEFVECVKKNLPPNSPTNLVATASGRNISLVWEDKSSDENGFKVYRKPEDVAEWAVVSTLGADVTVYNDSILDSATFMYRVVAFNNNGESLGSNVVLVSLD